MPRSILLYKRITLAKDLNEFNKIAEDLNSIMF